MSPLASQHFTNGSVNPVWFKLFLEIHLIFIFFLKISTLKSAKIIFFMFFLFLSSVTHAITF